MINFFDIEIKRVICHEIIPKLIGKEHGSVNCTNKLLILSQSVKELLIERLAEASQNQTKAFELEIGDYQTGSFFSNVYKMNKLSDAQFIESSEEIAHQLAIAHKKNTIPGGNFILIEAEDNKKRSIYIAIKAEMHKALRFDEIRNNEITILDDLFLSQQQKLYKFGVIWERTAEEKEQYSDLSYPNNEFGCFLFDALFTPDSKLAGYFYSDFLGFSIESNSKIQSKKFYVNTENFIKTNIETADDKEMMLSVLKQEFLTNNEPELSPTDFADLYFHLPEVRDVYKNEIAEYLPESIVKDTTLISNKLKRKKVIFANEVIVAGPNNTFDINVKVIKSAEELSNLDFSEGSFTLLKILGKPEQEQ